MLKKIDLIQFNSSISETIYKNYFLPKKSVVMTISHSNIQDARKTLSWNWENILRITYLGPTKPYKGYTVLKQALDELWNDGKTDFRLNIYNSTSDISPYMRIKAGGFKQSELSKIFAETDILVAPSVWYETFGFTVLEAISYGIPVIVSNRVGAKDIIGNGGIVLEAGDAQQLKSVVAELTEEKIMELRKSVQKDARIKTWRQLVLENYKMYEDN